MIASSCVIAGEASVAWGSKPLFDAFLSSGRFDIVDDGSELERHEKIAALGRYGDMLADLRVCHMSPTFEGNCGRCTKCRRTIAAFLAAGLPVPDAFPRGAARQRPGVRYFARRTLAELRSIDAYRYGRFTHQAARNAGVRSLQMRRLGLWLAAVGVGRGIVDAAHRLLGVGDPIAFNASTKFRVNSESVSMAQFLNALRAGDFVEVRYDGNWSPGMIAERITILGDD